MKRKAQGDHEQTQMGCSPLLVKLLATSEATPEGCDGAYNIKLLTWQTSLLTCYN